MMQAWLGLSNSHVTSIDGEHFLQPRVIEDFRSMQNAAASDGVDLQLFSSYRDFAKQASIWNRKWQGELPVLNEHNQPLNTKEMQPVELMHAILRWSALPGASRHHWGTDFDVYDRRSVENSPTRFQLIDEEYRSLGPCAELNRWLDDNMQTFGFFRPYAQYCGGIGAEPWHLSHYQTSREISDLFEPNQLRQAVSEARLAGCETVLQHFDEIYYRYVLNKGVPVL